MEIGTSLFSLFDNESEPETAGLILKILVLLTLEWFEDQTLRSHMLRNFSILRLDQEHLLSLIEPLCKYILMD